MVNTFYKLSAFSDSSMLCIFDVANFIVLFIEIFNFSYLCSTRKWCYSSCDIYKKKCINIFDQAWRRIPKRFVELVRYIEDSVFACDRVDKNIKKWGWYFDYCIRTKILIWYEATSPAIGLYYFLCTKLIRLFLHRRINSH